MLIWKTILTTPCLLCLLLDEVVQDVDGHGEDDGGVVLRGDGAQSLQVPQLQYRENEYPRPRLCIFKNEV